MTKEEIDLLLNVNKIASEEANYFLENGRYEQRLKYLSDFSESVYVSIDAYEGPSGHGYIINVSNGESSKAIDMGPGGWSYPWTDSIDDTQMESLQRTRTLVTTTRAMTIRKSHQIKKAVKEKTSSFVKSVLNFIKKMWGIK